MRLLKKAVALTIICAIFVFSITSVSAAQAGHYGYYSSDKIAYMSDEEIFNEVWYEFFWSTFGYEGDPLFVSITRYELANYLKDYEPLNSDTTISKVVSEFDAYGKEKYGKSTIEKNSENSYIETPNDNLDEVYTYTYNETKRMYICKNKNGKIVKTYERYFPEEDSFLYPDESSSSTASLQNSSRNETKSSLLPADTDSIVSDADPSTNYSQVSNEIPAETATALAEAPASNNNTIQTLIIIVIGILIVCGIVTIVILKKHDNSKER